MYTLVVVDMQFNFSASRKPSTIKNCQKQILQAMKDKAAIIFLEFDNYGRTIPELFHLVSSYNRAYFEIKHEDDGSQEVLALVKKHKLPKRNFKVCGVNTDFCVLATVSGLSTTLNRSYIKVVKAACNSNHSNRDGIRVMKSFERVAVI